MAMNFESTISRDDAAESYLTEDELESRRKRRNLIIATVVIAVALFLAWRLMGSGGSQPVAQDAAKQAAQVTVITPSRQLVAQTISATGSLAARREMPLGVVGEGGLVTRVWVEPGTWVRQGQVLASIERSVQSQESVQLSANISAADADARLAQANLERAQALVSRGFVSKADIDRLTATRDAARARVAVARAQLGANQARIGRLDIRAPEAGLVLTRAVEPGQVVGAGSGVLFRLARGGEMELRANLAESDLTRLSTGNQAKVTPVGSSTSFTGQIWQISPVVDPESRQGIVRIALAYNTALRPGGFASAEITSGQVEAPLLPESAVQSDERGNFVYVVNADKKVVRQPVRIGDVTDAGIPVLGGLRGNEQIVLSAGAFLNPGETVVPVRAKPGR
jgi:RND family efflux transporter MFP subunit